MHTLVVSWPTRRDRPPSAPSADNLRFARSQNYILHLHSPWAVCFFTAMSRKKALKTLKQLKLPTGGPEQDERDGVVGVFAKVRLRLDLT